jgi:hypothetical protein
MSAPARFIHLTRTRQANGYPLRGWTRRTRSSLSRESLARGLLLVLAMVCFSMQGCRAQCGFGGHQAIRQLKMPSGKTIKVYILMQYYMKEREGSAFGQRSDIQGTLINYGVSVNRFIDMHPFPVVVIGLSEDGHVVYINRPYPGSTHHSTEGGGYGPYGLYIAPSEFEELGLHVGAIVTPECD